MQITTDGSTLVLSGDFDVRSTGVVRAAIDEQLKSWNDDIIIDIRGVGGVDLTALKVLGAASRRALHEGHHILLRGASPQVLRMLHLTHLIRVVEVERATVLA